MSRYTIYYSTRRDMYRKLATSWSEAARGFDLTEEQRRGMRLFFRHIGKRFGLINEFKNIGVI